MLRFLIRSEQAVYRSGNEERHEHAYAPYRERKHGLQFPPDKRAIVYRFRAAAGILQADQLFQSCEVKRTPFDPRYGSMRGHRFEAHAYVRMQTLKHMPN